MGAPDHLLGPLAYLATFPQFVIAERATKIPLQASGLPASSTDPATWCSYETAAATVAAWGAAYGVGFVLTATDDLGVIDLDDALRSDGTWPMYDEMRAQLAGAVVEVSQSGRGLHVWFRSATMPEHAKKVTVNGQRLECYSAERYVLLGTGAVGHLADDCPGARQVIARYFPPREVAPTHGDGPRTEWRGPADDDELIRRALASRSAAGAFGGGVTFRDLWEGDAVALGRRWPSSGRPYDASSADAALASHLAWWSGCDSARIERLMQRSALRREKWDRPDYLPRTIANACAMTRDVCRERESLPTAVAHASAPVAAAPVNSSLTFAGAHKGWIDARLETVYDTLQSPECGISIRLDRFTEQPVIGRLDDEARPFIDVDYGRIRAEFQRRGFKPIPAETMKTAVAMAAHDNAFDSAHEYVNSLKWDNVPRIDAALPTYYRTADTPYTRAVGAYLFTALAGRSLRPGVQADMVPVLVGLQGERKSSAVQALCPLPEFFAEVNLKKIDDDNTARLIRGKLVGEIAELRGLFGQDRESIKAWITRRVENWIPKFIEFATTYPRRIVFIGTTNDREFLDDPSGERRWLPVIAGRVDVEGLERDREQLWAEGAARFKATGIAWQDAERLARDEHEGFKVRDPWCEPVEAWLARSDGPAGKANGSAPFRRGEVALGALHRSDTTFTPAEEKRLAKVLTLLGFESRAVRTYGHVQRMWVRKVPTPPVA